VCTLDRAMAAWLLKPGHRAIYVIALAVMVSCSIQTSVMAAEMPLTHNNQVQQPALTGEDIIMESLRRHELYPYVYEEQSLILMDAKQHRDVRRMKRYSRLEQGGTFKAMLTFTYPESIAGAALLFTRQQDGERKKRFYLPALGTHLIEYAGGVAGSQMLGSEFSLEDLMPEDMDAFEYHRMKDVIDGDNAYFVVQAISKREKTNVRRSYAERKLLIRQDNFFVTHVDYLDQKGALVKRQTRHDIHQVNGEMWRADMMMAENFLNHHRSILKVDRRVYSSDYVPESIFDISSFVPATSQPAAESSDPNPEVAEEAP